MAERLDASSVRALADAIRETVALARRTLACAVASACDGDALVAECLQCGKDRTDIVGMMRGRARISCRACGAVTIQDCCRLRPRAKRAGPDADHLADTPPAPKQAHPLAPYVSSELLEWAREAGRDRRAASPDKSTIYRLWKEFDRRGLGPELPAFSEIVGLLQARCYDERAVVEELTDADAGTGGAAVAERAGCARRWLAGPGREHCWIERVAVDAVDVTAARSLLEDGALDGALDGAQRAALYGAAFGATGGPPTKAILRRFDASTIARAIQTHLFDGSHPLREAVLSGLDGRENPYPPCSSTLTGERVPC